jgi:3-deoxy-7-phosphoheptulonate synthase
MSQIAGLWRTLRAEQQPDWPSEVEAVKVQSLLAMLPPLTSPAAARDLLNQLRLVQEGKAFLLQAGDCAEPFGSVAVAGARRKYCAMQWISGILASALEVPVFLVGRLAGQFAKPRTHPFELVVGKEIYAFRGLVVNSADAVESERRPDPHRMLTAYYTASLVLEELARLSGRGHAPDGTPPAAETVPGSGNVWVSHEALLLDYEEPLVRRDPQTGELYLLSTHLPWIGERTRQADGAHVALLASVANPVACKIGPDATEDEVLRLCEALDPRQTPGRLTLISRMGARLVRDRLPGLVHAVKRAGYPVIWICDPMHGNQMRTATGLKTRHVADVVAELNGFVEVMRDCGQWPGGVHLEIAGEDVTECLWDMDPATEEQLHRAYRSLCDGRLSNSQAGYVADRLATFLSGPSDAARSHRDAEVIIAGG